jgi:hypothetical protein
MLSSARCELCEYTSVADQVAVKIDTPELHKKIHFEGLPVAGKDHEVNPREEHERWKHGEEIAGYARSFVGEVAKRAANTSHGFNNIDESTGFPTRLTSFLPKANMPGVRRTGKTFVPGLLFQPNDYVRLFAPQFGDLIRRDLSAPWYPAISTATASKCTCTCECKRPVSHAQPTIEHTTASAPGATFTWAGADRTERVDKCSWEKEKDAKDRLVKLQAQIDKLRERLQSTTDPNLLEKRQKQLQELEQKSEERQQTTWRAYITNLFGFTGFEPWFRWKPGERNRVWKRLEQMVETIEHKPMRYLRSIRSEYDYDLPSSPVSQHKALPHKLDPVLPEPGTGPAYGVPVRSLPCRVKRSWVAYAVPCPISLLPKYDESFGLCWKWHKHEMLPYLLSKRDRADLDAKLNLYQYGAEKEAREEAEWMELIGEEPYNYERLRLHRMQPDKMVKTVLYAWKRAWTNLCEATHQYTKKIHHTLVLIPSGHRDGTDGARLLFARDGGSRRWHEFPRNYAFSYRRTEPDELTELMKSLRRVGLTVDLPAVALAMYNGSGSRQFFSDTRSLRVSLWFPTGDEKKEILEPDTAVWTRPRELVSHFLRMAPRWPALDHYPDLPPLVDFHGRPVDKLGCVPGRVSTGWDTAIPSDTFKTTLTFHAFVTRVQTERLERVLQPVTPTTLYGRQLLDRRCEDLWKTAEERSVIASSVG